MPGLPDAPDPLDYADGMPSQPGHNSALEGLLSGGAPSSGAEPSSVGGDRSLNQQQQQQQGPPGSGAGPRIDPASTASDLSSVQELLAEVEGGAHQGLIEILKGHTFVGMVGFAGVRGASGGGAPGPDPNTEVAHLRGHGGWWWVGGGKGSGRGLGVVDTGGGDWR